MAVTLPPYDEMAFEYLTTSRSLAAEIAFAMECIASNAMPKFVESVTRQVVLSESLENLAGRMTRFIQAAGQQHSVVNTCAFDAEIKAVWREIRERNVKYAALLGHSRKSIDQLTNLCKSFLGQMPGFNESGVKHQTWYCEA